MRPDAPAPARGGDSQLPRAMRAHWRRRARGAVSEFEDDDEAEEMNGDHSSYNETNRTENVERSIRNKPVV